MTDGRAGRCVARRGWYAPAVRYGSIQMGGMRWFALLVSLFADRRRSEAFDGLPDGAAVALDSDFDLLSDVVGKML
ncbi:hypothetical protein FHW12_000750 [Dokdonella fugitiva]|uniref:Uncharacterized protein n=1 Tax=Dokdonella fugitiva TaxID=328517 RepID=A0A839EXZ2_9GAMM|nr:hypothetical protein [Dokdonella fugitiva]MBA8886559.1 hypothetical protein [Dokdonella fugitiva]